jgi:hypothetical protein
MVTAQIGRGRSSVRLLACRHRRAAAALTEQWLQYRGLWGNWQHAALITGRCRRCR